MEIIHSDELENVGNCFTLLGRQGKAKIWFDLPNWEGFAISLCIRLYSKKDVVEEHLTSRYVQYIKE